MTIKEIYKMERCREKLNKCVEKYGLTHEKSLKASKELEKFFSKYFYNVE
ncbi:MAG: aspartyl-phosphate phosphatase Spo0E family protein [Clostridia bacterium]|nr:aspartyl-phosphate phosphatase Spo0E family protein [Clostridia bacterium]